MDNIRIMREKRGLTPDQLCDRIYASHGCVKNWESGVCCPSISSLVALARFFNVSTDVILDLRPVPKRYRD